MKSPEEITNEIKQRYHKQISQIENLSNLKCDSVICEITQATSNNNSEQLIGQVLGKSNICILIETTENEIIGGLISSPIVKNTSKQENNELTDYLQLLMGTQSIEEEYCGNCSFLFNLSNTYPLKFTKKYTKNMVTKEKTKRLLEEESFRII